jgi:transcriptional regulator with XRE-family HTH domain
MAAKKKVFPLVERSDWSTSSLGERIAHVIALRNWNVNKLGEVAGLSQGLISRLARRPEHTAGTPETLARIADAAKVNVLWLMLGRGPIERIEPRTNALRDHADWPAALAEAKKWQRGIPEDFWQLAGDSVIPTPPRLTWQLVVGITRELYSAHQLWLEEAEKHGESSSEGPATEAQSSMPPARSTIRSRNADTKNAGGS